MSDLEVSGGMLGSASAQIGSVPLPLSELIKSSIKRSSHATAIVNFKGRIGKDTQYSLYFVSDACGLTQHLCLVDVDSENPYQVAVIMADRDALKELRAACEKALALIDAVGEYKGPRSVSEELKEQRKDWPKEGWYKDVEDTWHYCKVVDDSENAAICGNFSTYGNIRRLIKKPKGKKCSRCVEVLEKK